MRDNQTERGGRSFVGSLICFLGRRPFSFNDEDLYFRELMCSYQRTFLFGVSLVAVVGSPPSASPTFPRIAWGGDDDAGGDRYYWADEEDLVRAGGDVSHQKQKRKQHHLTRHPTLSPTLPPPWYIDFGLHLFGAILGAAFLGIVWGASLFWRQCTAGSSLPIIVESAISDADDDDVDDNSDGTVITKVVKMTGVELKQQCGS